MSQLTPPLAALMVASVLALPSAADEIRVETVADAVVGPICNLRDAIRAANTDASSGGCDGGSGADLITFEPGLSGTIELASALPKISAPVTIRGPGADQLAISGMDQAQVLLVEDAGTVVLEGLTLQDGSAGRGGCLQARGFGAPTDVTLRDCRITSCSAFNGGGIANDGATMRIERCLVDGNATTGNSGAGVTNSGGLLDIVNSTISGNETTGADRVGGGIATFDPGGDVTETRIHSSTIADNGAPDGGNVYSSGAATRLTHALLAAPRLGGNCSGNVVSDGHNLDDDGTCAFAEVGDLEDDPMLGPLADNGGATATHLPAPASPVVDAGLTVCLDTDGTGLRLEQRGTGRRADGDGDGIYACDIGAIEALPEPGAGAAGLAVFAALAAGAHRRRLE